MFLKVWKVLSRVYGKLSMIFISADKISAGDKIFVLFLANVDKINGYFYYKIY